MDIVSNLISIIKNGYNLRRLKVKAPYNNLSISILSTLYKLGYISGFTFDFESKKYVWIYLKYINNQPVLRNIVRISTPGKRIYLTVYKLKKILHTKSNGFILFSTSKGVLTDEEALLFNIGGEPIIRVN